MLSPDSILRRLPHELSRRQMLFLDGIRHASDFAELAHTRLIETLTGIGTRAQTHTPSDVEHAEAFLYAWALVDSLDRFHSLWRLMPNARRLAATPEDEKGIQFFKSVRALRNVADHLAQRADYVVARSGTALGELTWFTFLDPQCTHGVSCLLVPGPVSVGRRPMVNPIGTSVAYPSGQVHLSAGEHRACLSDAIPELTRLVTQLETALTAALSEAGLAGHSIEGDIFVSLHFSGPPARPSGPPRSGGA